MTTSLPERFLGRGVPTPTAPVANPALTDPPAFLVLFPGRFDLPADGLAAAVRDLHPSLRGVVVELLDVSDAPARADNSGTLVGLIAWGPHVVKVLGFAGPAPAGVFDACVRPAHVADELKVDAARHESHVLLQYAGYDADPLERYVALAAAAAALVRFDALLILNEAARAAFPAEALPAAAADEDLLESLRTMPLPLLYMGFVKVEVEGEPGVWARTFGGRLLDLPDLAVKIAGHEQGEEAFELTGNLLAYMRESGARVSDGDVAQFGDDVVLKFRKPADAEWYLRSDGEMVVGERVE